MRTLDTPPPGIYLGLQGTPPPRPGECCFARVLDGKGIVLWERSDLSQYQARRIGAILNGKIKLPIYDDTERSGETP